MSINTMQGLVRAATLPSYGQGQSQSPSITERGDLLMALGLPGLADLVRQGNTWSVAIDTSEAFTYVNGWPTTRAELVLYNGEGAGGKSLVIDSVFMADVSSAAAAQSKAILGQMGASGIAAPTDNTGLLITSRSGKTYGGNARKAVANTAFAIANKWEALAVANNVQAASIGAGIAVDLFGKWVIPPGRSFCLAGLASTAAGTAILGVTWHEIQLTLP